MQQRGVCPYSSVSESLSPTNPFNRRMGASVIMICVESIFFCISRWVHPRNGAQPYEHNWIWNLQTQPKNLRLSDGPQNMTNHDDSFVQQYSFRQYSASVLYVCVCMCIYIYIYTHPYFYIYTYIPMI